jgi:CheY-like chemotaxis protein
MTDIQTRGSILLAEDDDSVATLVAFKLKRAGFEVERVARGDLAFERLASAARSGSPFRFVILDGRLPGRDGISIMEEASAFGWVEAGVIASADEWVGLQLPRGWTTLRKPFDLSLLVDLVRQGIESSPGRVSTGTRTDTEDEVIAGLRADFRASFGVKSRSLNEILEQPEGESRTAALLAFAHNLAGAAGTYGFLELAERASRVESAAGDEARESSAQALLAKLNGER